MENKKKKPGRKALPEYARRCIRIPVKVSKSEMELVERCADECGLSVATYAYHAVMGVKLSPKLSAEEMKAVKSLSNIGNNINQMARNSNLGLVDKKQASEIISYIHSILKSIK